MEIFSTNVSCVILAGGKNTRLGGKNKAFLKINDKTIIEDIIEKLNLLFNEIIIVSNTPDDYNNFLKGIKIVTDLVENKGPLGGIYTGLCQISTQVAFIVSCDMPFLNIDLIKNQILDFGKNRYDIFIPRINNNIEPLHSIYKKSILKKLGNHLETSKKTSVRDFFSLVNSGYFDIEDSLRNQKAFTNINTAEDLLKIVENESL